MKILGRACARKQTMTKALGFAISAMLLLTLGLAGCSSDEHADDSSRDASSSSTLGSSTIAEPDAERSIPDPDAPKISITVVVDPTQATEAGAGVSGFEEPLTFGDLVLTEGDSALDALFDTGVVVTTSGLYATDINGLAAGAAGEGSGWVYEVNGESPMMSAFDYRLADGDVVTWRFVTSFEG